MISQDYAYDAMASINSRELKNLLVNLASLITNQMKEALTKQSDSNISNQGAIDKVFLQNKEIIAKFVAEVNRIINDLVILGHKFNINEQDLSNDLDQCNIYISSARGDNAQGLEIEFYPNRTNVRWMVSGYA